LNSSELITPDRDPSEVSQESRKYVSQINAKAKSGVKQMLCRQAIIQVFTFAGGIVLARTLTPEIFGVFGIATFFVTTLALFGDFGLAPSLIQRKEDLTENDLQVAFTLQQTLLSFVALSVWIAAPLFLSIYPSLSGLEYVWLVRVMALTLFLQSWRSISVLQLERHMEFKAIARIEIVETLTFQALAVGFALAGLGVWSLVWATLARGVLGTVLAFALSPWRVRFAWDWPKVKEILRFGLPFQAGTILNSAADWVTPLFVGTLVGPAGIGYLTWASANGRKPLVLMGPIVRVSFPHFARLQHDEPALQRAFERYLYPLLLLNGLWFVLVLLLAGDLVPLIYTEKWVPAIDALHLYSAAMGINMIGWMTAILLRSTGHITYNIKVQTACSAASVAISFPLIYSIGLLAIPVAMIITMTIRMFAFLYKAPKGCWKSVKNGLAKTSCTIGFAVSVGLCIRPWLPHAWVGSGILLATTIIAYGLATSLCMPVWFKSMLAEAFRNKLSGRLVPAKA
jgi:O-antigen/teichoic acid export membrane protein